jgi:hypothetical protein
MHFLAMGQKAGWTKDFAAVWTSVHKLRDLCDCWPKPHGPEIVINPSAGRAILAMPSIPTSCHASPLCSVIHDATRVSISTGTCTLLFQIHPM